MTNPFVYGEVVPAASFVDREVEVDRLTRDLLAGQKVFLISPRRYGKSSLVRRALDAAERSGALAIEVTVSSYSSYVAFLEGYARALLSLTATGLKRHPNAVAALGAPPKSDTWLLLRRSSGSRGRSNTQSATATAAGCAGARAATSASSTCAASASGSSRCRATSRA